MAVDEVGSDEVVNVQREVERSWESRSEALRRSRAADPEVAAAAEARMAQARERAAAAQREREQRDAALLVQFLYVLLSQKQSWEFRELHQ